MEAYFKNKYINEVALFEEPKYNKQLFNNLSGTIEKINEQSNAELKLKRTPNGYEVEKKNGVHWTGTLAEAREYITGIAWALNIR